MRSSSRDITEVFQHATRFARRREEDKWTVQVVDILRAIIEPPLNGKFVSLFTPVGILASPEEIGKNVAAIRGKLEISFPDIEAKLNSLAAEVAGNSLRISSLENNIGPSDGHETLRHAIGALKSRLRTIKYTGFSALGFYFLAFIIAVVAYISVKW